MPHYKCSLCGSDDIAGHTQDPRIPAPVGTRYYCHQCLVVNAEQRIAATRIYRNGVLWDGATAVVQKGPHGTSVEVTERVLAGATR